MLQVGNREVIQGWDQAILGTEDIPAMKVSLQPAITADSQWHDCKIHTRQMKQSQKSYSPDERSQVDGFESDVHRLWSWFIEIMSCKI